MKKTLIIVGSLILAGGLLWGGFYWLGANAIGGGGSDQYPPETVKAGEPAVIKLVLSVWGGGGAIQGRFTDISLHYRLVGESDYKIISPEQIALPDNYKDVVSKNNQWIGYEFTIPPYSKGTTGQIEYYIDMTLDGYQSRHEGVKKILLK